MPGSSPNISVVIATRNRCSALQRCVEAIRAQDYPQELRELIIVDDGSTDETPAYLAVLAAQERWIKVVSQVRGWQANARNKGILLASGPLIAITDDDCVVARDWLQSLDSAMQDPRLAGVGGHVEAAGDCLVARYLDHVCALDPLLLPNGRPQQLITANACFRRSALERTGLFDETFAAVGGEDTELALRMRRKGMKFQFVPTCRVAHWFEPELDIFLGRFYRYGLGIRQIFEKHLAWEYWFPRVNAKIQVFFNELACGNVQFRGFHEIADPALRSWFCFLSVIQRFSFLAGYLALQSVEPFLPVPQPGVGEPDRPSAEAGKMRREQAEAILQAFPVDPLPMATDPANREFWFDREHFPPQETNTLRRWVCTLIKQIGMDLLLELASSPYPPHEQSADPDASLSAIVRRAYLFRQSRHKDAYARQNRHLLAQLTRQAESPTLTHIEALCYAHSIGVNRFLSWYGELPGVGPIQP